MFKAHLKTKTNNTNVSELELKAKFDKYTVDPNQKLGRPRKEIGDPQKENLDEKYLKENMLEYAYNQDKYARAEISRLFQKLFPDKKDIILPNDIEKFMGWDLNKEKTQYSKERDEFYAEEGKEEYKKHDF